MEVEPPSGEKVKKVKGLKNIKNMKSDVEIIPAIIPKSLKDLEANLERTKSLVKKVQIDILDGRYDDNISWPYENKFVDFDDFEEQKKGLSFWQDFDFEFDLMIKNPEMEADKFLNAGVDTLIYHFESTEALGDCIEKTRLFGVKVGLALKPSTPLEKIFPYLGKVDFVQFMGNDNVGEHNVVLDERVYEKIKDLHSNYPECIIGVDIGVNFDTAPKLIKAGATRLVSGSAIFESPNIKLAIKRLKGDA